MSDIDKPTRCEAVYIGADEKEHGCILDTGHRGKCLCACGEKSIKTKTPLKLAHWKRGKKVVK
jgi:hypothetical protein